MPPHRGGRNEASSSNDGGGGGGGRDGGDDSESNPITIMEGRGGVEADEEARCDGE